MKTKLLCFSLLMLAIGGSLFGQTLTPAGSSTGSITTNAANCNTTNACIILHLASSNVGYSVTVSSTWTGTLTIEQSGDNQGSWTSATTTTANTLYTSALTPGITDVRVRGSAAMTGTAVVTITASGPATLQQITQAVGSSSSSPSSPGAVIASSAPYNAKFNVHWGTLPTFASGSSIVTCTDCNFNSSDILSRPYAVVGQIVWGSTETVDTSAATSTLTTPECVIQSIDSNTQIHMGTIGAIGTPCNATASTTASGHIWWGDLDSASSLVVQSTANDALFNAWSAAANACAQLVFPVGAAFIEQGEFITYPTTKACGKDSSVQSERFGFSIRGQGRNATFLIPTPNFLPTTCIGPNTAGSTCLFAFQDPFVSDLQIHGGGNSACGVGFSGKNLTGVLGNTSNSGSNALYRKLLFMGWCANTAGTIGLNIGLIGGQNLAGSEFDDVWVENFGCNAVFSNPGNGNIVQWHLGDYWNNSGCDHVLKINTGTFKSDLGFHCGNTSSPVTYCVQMITNTTYYTTDDFLQLNFQSGNGIFMQNGTTVHAKGSQFPLTAFPNTGFYVNPGSTGTVYLQDIDTFSLGRAFYSDTGATLNIFDGGNNQWVVGTPGPGVVKAFGGFPSFTGTAPVAANIALGAGYGTTAAPTFTGTDPKHFTITLTLAGSLVLATETITYTYPTEKAGLPAAFNTCKATPVGGTQFAAAAYSFLTTTAPTTTSVVFTQQTAAGTAANTEIIAIDCQ